MVRRSAIQRWTTGKEIWKLPRRYLMGSTCTEENGFNTLPEELKAKTLNFLSGTEAARFRKLSKRLGNLIDGYKILEHKLFVINTAYSAEGTTQTVCLWIGDTKFSVERDIVYQLYDWLHPLTEVQLGYHAVSDRLYQPGKPNAGEEFLRKLLPLSSIGHIDERFRSNSNQFAVRFFEIVAETRCPIGSFHTRRISDVKEVLQTLKKSNFHSRQNVMLRTRSSIQHEEGFWDVFQEITFISNFTMSVSFAMFQRLFQNIISLWMWRPERKHSFSISCDLMETISSSDAIGPHMESWNLIFEGFTVQEFLKMRRVTELPETFRVVNPSDGKSASFTKQPPESTNIVVVFHDQ